MRICIQFEIQELDDLQKIVDLLEIIKTVQCYMEVKIGGVLKKTAGNIEYE